MAARGATVPGGPDGSASENAPSISAEESRLRSKKLNLNTLKWHAMGDVPGAIRRFGTTDSYSTQRVSMVLMTAFSFMIADDV